MTQAITGLGGMGKTALAVEYAYRQTADFDFIFLANASSVSSLEASYREMATRLELPQATLTDTSVVVDGVKEWLSGRNGYPQTTKGCLLILDNADFDADYKAEDFRHFLPAEAVGKILITTRSQTLAGVPNITRANLIPISELLPADAVTFLWERVNGKGVPMPDSEAATVAELASRLYYFPLALEQAGAYIGQNAISYAEYVADYRAAPMEMLAEAKAVNGHFTRADEYRQAVHTTWHFNLQALQRAGKTAAVDLFTLCAFLTPDDIPEIIVYVAAHGVVDSLTPLFADAKSDVQFRIRYRNLIKILSDYSLVTPHSEDHTFSVHRLTQDVVKHRLTVEETVAWENRVIETLNGAFPDPDFTNWPLCQWLTPNVQAMEKPIRNPQTNPEIAGRLLNQAAYFLKAHAHYLEAEPLYQKALEIYKTSLPNGHHLIASILNNLAELYRSQARYSEVEIFLKQALEIHKSSLPDGHPVIASNLNNLASLYCFQERYSEAEPLFRRALEIDRQALGEDHPKVGIALNNMAELYRAQGLYSEAEPLFKQALEIRNTSLPRGHPDIAHSLNNLASLYCFQERYSEAEPLFKQALEIDQQALGENHPDFALHLNNLAELYKFQMRYLDAEPLYQQSLAIFQSILGENHPTTQTVAQNVMLFQFEKQLYEARKAGWNLPDMDSLSPHERRQLVIEVLREMQEQQRKTPDEKG